MSSQVPFCCTYLPYRPNGNMVFYAGALFDKRSDKLFFTAEPSVIESQQTLEPLKLSPGAILSIVSQHWQNDRWFKNQTVRYATPAEGEQFLRDFPEREQDYILVTDGMYPRYDRRMTRFDDQGNRKNMPTPLVIGSAYEPDTVYRGFRLLLVVEEQPVIAEYPAGSPPALRYDPAAPSGNF